MEADNAPPHIIQTNLELVLLKSRPAIGIDIACPRSSSGNIILVVYYVRVRSDETILKYDVA